MKRIEQVIITGFGKFADVLVNPTTQIVNSLEAENWQPENVPVEFHIVEVSTTATDQLLENIPDGDKILRIHLGVDQRATCFKLERTAYNNMNFRVPDENGFMPSDQCIDSLDLEAAVCTTLNLDEVCGAMNVKGYEVIISTDPGRFLCNFIYYKSLRNSSRDGGGAIPLFVHVPPVSVVALENQIYFVKALIECIICMEHS